MFDKCSLNAQHIKTLWTNFATFQAFCAQFHSGRAHLQGFFSQFFTVFGQI